MKLNIVNISRRNIVEEMKNLARLILEGSIHEGDIIAKGVYDKNGMTTSREDYELVIEANSQNKEIRVIRQSSNLNIICRLYKASDKSLELNNLELYASDSEEYLRWKEKFAGLEIWRDKK